MERNLPSSKREQEDLTSSNRCDYSRTWYRSVLSVLLGKAVTSPTDAGLETRTLGSIALRLFAPWAIPQRQGTSKGPQCYGGTKGSHSLGAGPSDLVLAGKRAGEHDSCESYDSVGFTMS